jgi:SAM-dependent methyltransferase
MDYRARNLANWDERAPVHADDCRADQFVDDPDHLSGPVRFDLPRLGDITGLRGVHLQCHIGHDTVSLSRLGARMTGLDFSSAAVTEARRLVARSGDRVDFVEADVYDAVGVLGESSYDLVFTGLGALCFLPSADRWAAVVQGLLKPGGRLFVREGHPALWSIDEGNTAPVLTHPYFERPEPLAWPGGRYVGTGAHTTYEWNHSIGEVVTALLGVGMEITGLAEHDSVPWEALPGQMVRSGHHDEWQLADRPERLPASYALQAVKR